MRYISIKEVCFLILVIMLNFNMMAQNSPKDLKDFENRYLNYFKMNRELLFVHLNKTKILPKENLWFSVYVLDLKTGLPNMETANLNLEVLDSNGNLMDTQTVLASAGKASGFINIDTKNYTPGIFHIRVYTNYMRNYKEDLSYLQSFLIIGEKDETRNEKAKMDLQILPEGGHLIEGIENSIGVKLLDEDGHGITFTNGELLNAKNEILTSFKSNQFGLAKFKLKPVTNENYKISITVSNGKIETKEIPQAKKEGLNLIVENQENSLLFSLTTSDTNYVANKTYYAAIHQAGKIKDFAFKFPQGVNTVDIKWKKDSLYPGVNSFTLLNETFKPLIERQFFNRKGIKHIEVAANFRKKEADSLQIEITADQKVQNNSLSISVLPENSISYDARHNLLSALYLKPYLKGTIESPTYYFSDSDMQQVNENLDLLMLTQGWSKYEWDSIYLDDLQELYKREIGFDLKGRVNSKISKKENSILVESSETGLSEIISISARGEFSLQNIYVLDSSAISLGLINERSGKITKPSTVANIFPLKSFKAGDFLFNPVKGKELINKYESVPNNFVKDPKALALDTVQLVGENKKGNRYSNELKVIKPEVIITEELERRYKFITDYIGAKGFKVIDGGYGYLEINNKTPTSIGMGDSVPSPQPQIYFNGVNLGKDTSPLVYLPTSEVESIIISTSGAGYGMNGFNGVIEITTKKGNNRKNYSETITEVITENGFSANKKFYTPKYTSYNSKYFNEYGVIDWYSDVYLNAMGKAKIKVLNTLQTNLKIIIEGITVDGFLFSENLEVEIR